MKDYNTKSKINYILDCLQKDDDYFDELVSHLEDDPQYLTNNELFIILAKVKFKNNNSYVACQKKNILISFLQDKILCTQLLFSVPFCTDFIYVQNKKDFNIIQYMDIDYLIDNIDKVDIGLDEMIYVYILSNCSLEVILKFLNNDYVTNYFTNKDVRNDNNLINSKEFYKIIGTKFMSKVFPASFYAYVLATEYGVQTFNNEIVVEKNLEEIGDIIRDYNISKNKKILIVDAMDIPRRQKNDLLKKIFNKGMVCEKEVNNIHNDIINNLVNLQDDGIIKELNVDIRENYIGFEYFDEILKKLFANSNKKISFDYFDVIAYFLCRDFLNRKNYNDINIYLCTFPYGSPIAASFEYNSKTIYINSEEMVNKWGNFLYSGNAEKHYCWLAFLIAHEIGHITQNKEFLLNNKNYETLRALKEFIIYSSYPTYYSHNNHEDIAFEIDANMKAVEDEFAFYERLNLMDKIDFKIAKTKKEFFDIFKNDLMNHRLRTVDTANNDDFPKLLQTEINNLYNYSFSKKDCQAMINSYPLLAAEYNSDGSSKTFDEILKKFNYYKNKVDKDIYCDEDYDNYIFYRNLYQDHLQTILYTHQKQVRRKKHR